jgi:hypothetical protein
MLQCWHTLLMSRSVNVADSLQLLAAVSEAEREVAEVRQLREEEDALLLTAVQAMAALWLQLQEVRRLQGGRHLTDLAFSVVQLPPAQGEEAPMQAVSSVHTMAQCTTEPPSALLLCLCYNPLSQHSVLPASELMSCYVKLVEQLPWVGDACRMPSPHDASCVCDISAESARREVHVMCAVV